jgi:heavy metal sensor kinase
MRGRLSIGLRWTFRYTLALLVTVSIFGSYTYSRIAARTEQDAKLVLALQVEELMEAIDRAGVASNSVANSLDRSVTVAESDLKLGLQVFDTQGRLLHAGGSLLKHPLDLPREVREGKAERFWREMEAEGENYPYVVVAVRHDSAFVQGSLYTRKFVRNARDVRDIYLYSALPLLLITAVLGYWLARGSLRPIQEINRTARRISSTHLEEPIPTTGSGDELDELANTLNDMMQRIRQGVTRMRRFSANAAHELRTPLNAIRSQLEVTLEKEREPTEYRHILTELAGEVESLSNSVHGMMRLAQSEAGLPRDQRVPVDLVGLLREVIEFFEPLASEAGVAIQADLGPPISVPGDPSWLHQLFANLLHNALKYTPAGGRILVLVEVQGPRVAVHVTDTGIGIAAEEADRVFEPFHRVGVRQETPGVGLGLTLAREIARAHDGEIVLASEPGKGSTFSVWLPRGIPWENQ